jgi:hypothetical protein
MIVPHDNELLLEELGTRATLYIYIALRTMLRNINGRWVITYLQFLDGC